MGVTFLFGAGASAFCGDCLPSCPPLGAGLFDRLAARGGVAAKIEPDLAAIFRTDFEAGMLAFRDRHEADTTAFVREMADYFVRFRPGVDNTYHDFVRLLNTARKSVVLGTLNYELLLEIAISQSGRKLSYTTTDVGRSLPVLKLHGSCNFLPDLAPRHISGLNVIIGGPHRDLGTLVEANVRAADAPEVIEYCAREDFLAPVMSLYAKGKIVLMCPKFVADQQRQWAESLRSASAIVIVGVRLVEEDEHIWKPLARTKAPIHYVGPEFQPLRDWADQERPTNIFHMSTKFETSLEKLRGLLLCK